MNNVSQEDIPYLVTNFFEAPAVIIEGERTEELALFLKSIERLGLTVEKVKGNVLVVGPNARLPEAALLFTKDSDFHELRSTITTLSCCDNKFDLWKDPNRVPLPLYWPDWAELPQSRDQIYFYRADVNEVLSHNPAGFYDTITAFRFVEMEDLLFRQYEGLPLIERIDTSLRVGGNFIGSGSFKSTDPKSLEIPSGLNLVQFAELPKSSPVGHGINWGFVGHHMGIILEKIP
jgi:hypothetical protein